MKSQKKEIIKIEGKLQNEELCDQDDQDAETPSQVETLPSRKHICDERINHYKRSFTHSIKKSIESDEIKNNERNNKNEIEIDKEEENSDYNEEKNNEISYCSNIEKKEKRNISQRNNKYFNNKKTNKNFNENKIITNHIILNNVNNSNFSNYHKNERSIITKMNIPQKNNIILKRLEKFENSIEKIWKDIKNLKEELENQEYNQELNNYGYLNHCMNNEKFICLKGKTFRKYNEEELSNDYKFTRDIYKKNKE